MRNIKIKKATGNVASRKNQNRKTSVHCNSLESQRERLAEELRKGPLTTLEIRHQLDILGVAPRIFELRHSHNLNIQTHWSDAINPGGTRHRVAKYFLMPGSWKESANVN